MDVVASRSFWTPAERDKWLQSLEPGVIDFSPGFDVHPQIFYRWVGQAAKDFPAVTSTETYWGGDQATYLKKVERDMNLNVYQRLPPKFLQTQQERAKERLHEDHVRTVLEAAGPVYASPGQAKGNNAKPKGTTCKSWLTAARARCLAEPGPAA